MSNSTGALVQIASYNTNLQGSLGLPQDLVDWLKPTLATSENLAPSPPDIVAVGFQELLPLHLGFTGQSSSVIASRNTLILKEIEKYSGDDARYSLVASIVNVGVALLVYAIDDGVGRRIADVQTSWTGCGPLNLGNKGAVGVRFRVQSTTADPNAGLGEVFTFVNLHLTAHAHNLPRRLQDYTHITRTLLFPPLPDSNTNKRTTMYSTSHLFVFGDLNFRLAKGPELDEASLHDNTQTPEGRRLLATSDELTNEIRSGKVCAGLREGDFTAFPPSYKYVVGTEDTYSKKRQPAWTDRVLYTTHSDSPEKPTESNIVPILYTSVIPYTTSDHKPIVALLRVPSAPPSSVSQIPLISPPPPHLYPSRFANFSRYRGKALGWVIGWMWYLFNFIGMGNAGVGVSNFVLGLGAVSWWRRTASPT